MFSDCKVSIYSHFITQNPLHMVLWKSLKSQMGAQTFANSNTTVSDSPSRTDAITVANFFSKKDKKILNKLEQ